MSSTAHAHARDVDPALDDHGHEGHSHGIGGHGQPPANFGKAFAIGIALNLARVLGEAFYCVVSHSLALLADAGHNLGDVLGLAGAWIASILSRRAPSARFTYGLRGSSILAALGNAVDCWLSRAVLPGKGFAASWILSRQAGTRSWPSPPSAS